MTLIAAIEQASPRAWPPEEVRGLHGWLLLAGRTASRRQNAVRSPAFDRGLPLDEAIATVEEWYRRRGRRPCFQITRLSRPEGLDAALEDRGYRLEAPTDVLVRPLASLPEALGEVILEGRATALVMNAIADPYWSKAERAARAALFARIRRPLAFAARTVGGEPVAGGLCVVDGPLAGLAAIRTRADARGKGHGLAVMARLLGWAKAMGAETAWLQVETDNAPAQALHRRLGFTRLYGYHYRLRED